MLDWSMYVLLLVILLAGWGANLLAMPGLWVMLAASAVYGACTRLAFVGWGTLGAVTAMALVGELVETGLGGAMTRRAGGGRPAVWGAIIGGILGGIFLSIALSFLPVISTVVGVLLGSALGAGLMELMSGRRLRHSISVGIGAAQGRALGIAGKVALGFVVFVVVAWEGLPIRHHPKPATPATTMPSSPTAAISPAATQSSTAP
jgi:uncharacterized protein YqgC (DUF456 family)